MNYSSSYESFSSVDSEEKIIYDYKTFDNSSDSCDDNNSNKNNKNMANKQSKNINKKLILIMKRKIKK